MSNFVFSPPSSSIAPYYYDAASIFNCQYNLTQSDYNAFVLPNPGNQFYFYLAYAPDGTSSVVINASTPPVGSNGVYTPGTNTGTDYGYITFSNQSIFNVNPAPASNPNLCLRVAGGGNNGGSAPHFLDVVTGDTNYPATSYVYYINSPVCFNKGTKILCYDPLTNEDVYILIEDLTHSTLVKTYKHGYRKVNLIVHNCFKIDPSSIWSNCMYVLYKQDDMTDDLVVTGGHSILIDKLTDYDLEKYKEMNIFKGETNMIDDKYLLLAGVSKIFTKLLDNDVYTYYHFTLDNDGDDDRRFGVWANGILSETPSKNYLNKNEGKMIFV